MSNLIGRPGGGVSAIVGVLAYIVAGDPVRITKVTRNHCSDVPCGSGPVNTAAGAPGVTTGTAVATPHDVFAGFVLHVRFERQMAPAPTSVRQLWIQVPQYWDT